MTEFQKFKEVLAMTESENQPEKFGDAGRACGRWQIHPEFFSDYHPLPAKTGETWDQWFERTLQCFWLAHRSKYQSVFTMADIFHLGLTAWEHGEHDPKYSARFQTWWELHDDEPAETEVS